MEATCLWRHGDLYFYETQYSRSRFCLPLIGSTLLLATLIGSSLLLATLIGSSLLLATLIGSSLLLATLIVP